VWYFSALLRVTIALVLSGCATLREPDESAWQTMHVIDTIQTVHLVSDSRYKEVESAWLIGAHPSDETVLAWSMGTALAHAGITHLLVQNEHPRLAKIWQYVTLSALCSTVGQNAAIGISIGGPNSGPDSKWRPMDSAANRLFAPTPP